jgi:hypothetical protein
MQLYLRTLHPLGSVSKSRRSTNATDSGGLRVFTQQTVILYGGVQYFDSDTGTLRACLTLRNRGNQPIRAPIIVEAMEVNSAIGAVSILNATNELAGAGAIWDISDSVTGNQIPPGASSSPFCLFFHSEIPPRNVSSPGVDDILILKMRVLASAGEDAK